MAIKDENKGLEQQLGICIGKIEGLCTDIKRLNGDLKTHITEHKQGMIWLIPTVISFATLIMLLLTYVKG